MVRSARRLPPTIPGPAPPRFWGAPGNTYRFGRDSVGRASQLFAEHGPLVALSRGGGTRIYSPHPDCPGTVITFGVEAAREMATRDEVYHKAALSGTLFPLAPLPAKSRRAALNTFGTGLFAVNGNQHRLHRRLMSPAFSRPRLRTYLDDMIRITEDCVGRWTVGEPLEVAAAMEEITRRIATKTLFGEDAGAAEAADSRSSAASGPAASNRGVEPPAGTGSLIQHALRELANPWTKLLPFDLPGMPYHRFLNASNRLQTAIREIVRRKQERMRDEGDVLSVLIRARDEESGLQLTDEQLLGHVGVLFAAGHETSANALNWTLLLLSQHPRICGDVVDELRSVLRGGVPTAEQLEKLPLLESVIKESMRVLPPVPWNGRVMSRADCLLDHDLPAGTEVFLSIYQTHHSPELFARPRRFDPRRWEGPEPSPFAYMPFSVGPRKCIGAAFAMVEMKIVLAAVLQRYRLEYLPLREINRLGHIVMTPKFGLPMRVHRQDGRFEQGVGGVRGNVREMVELPGD